MNYSMLKVGDQLISALEITYVVAGCLGSGGQGEVYEVLMGNNRYALKWYHVHMATSTQKKRIQDLIRKGSPDARFLWPMDYIETEETFGYIMPLRENHFKSIMDLMKRKAEPTFETLCKIGYELADCFQKLHSLGYAYGDLSFGNTFFDPLTGEVLICDNDNVVVNGLEELSVQGTIGFMAPEIVRGEKGPSTETDLFSLAVLLFYIFMMHHPLEGAKEANIKCLDLIAREKIYGKEPLFIWDTKDDSNRPIAGYQDNAIIYWGVYPKFLKDLFMVSFTKGMHNPKERIVENQWKRAFLQLKESMMICPKCGVEVFYNGEAHLGTKPTCWGCHQSLEYPLVLELPKGKVVLKSNTIIYGHYLDQEFDLNTKVLEVTQHPKDPNKWGLKNKTSGDLVVIKEDGQQIIIPTEKSFLLVANMQIIFKQGQNGYLRRG